MQVKLLKFYMNSCVPCKRLDATIASVPMKYDIVPIDIEQEPERAYKYGIRSVPTLVLVDVETDKVIKGPRTGAMTLMDYKEFIGE